MISKLSFFRRPTKFFRSASLFNFVLTFLTLFNFGVRVSVADNPLPLDIDVAHATIEQLLQMRVTSVSKSDEEFRTSPAAVYVLTNEKIRRSGATNIPEALRLVPGVQVARIDANKWAVSIRGFNSRTSNKLLVLVDGRSVYDYIFAGVIWESKDVMLDDVDRIEVVRGPGGTLWGSNAVNGVINIITKSAKETQGGLLSAGGGNEEQGMAALRYGSEIGTGTDAYGRVYAKYNNRDSGFLNGGQADDESEFGQTGFRVDKYSGDEMLSLQGDLYNGNDGNADDQELRDEKTQGGNLLFHWNHKISESHELRFLSYYDHTELNTEPLGEIRDSFAGDIEDSYFITPRNRLVTGLHYVFTTDHIRNTDILSVTPTDRDDQIVSAFIDDRYAVVEDKVFLTVGSKFEYNTYTQFEAQPSARLSWIIDDQNMVWTAVSRAVRVPSRLEDDLQVQLAPGLEFDANRNADAEELIAYEVGYRVRPMDQVFFDFATFYNQYNDLVSVERDTFGNHTNSESAGAEISAFWNPIDNLGLEAAYTYLHINVSLDKDSLASSNNLRAIEGSSPANQFSLRSQYDFAEKWQVDAAIRYVDSLPANNVGSYITGDVRLAYEVNQNLELSVVGQNLFEDHYFERGTAASVTSSETEVERGVYGKAVWRF